MAKGNCTKRTLVDILHWRAAHQFDRRAFTFLSDGESKELAVTYGELDRQARRIAGLVNSLGGRDSRVLLLHPPGLEFIAAFMGCMYAKAVAVPAYPLTRAKQLPRLEAIVKDSEPRLALTTSSAFQTVDRLLRNTSLAKIPPVAPSDDSTMYESDVDMETITEDTLAFLQYTSGSTSAPKGVMLTHGNLAHNLRLIEQAFEHTENSVGVGWLPMYHDMGLIGNVLQPLFVGFPSVLMSHLHFIERPARWLKAISTYRATTSGGPSFAYNLCVQRVTPVDKLDLDLTSWSLAFNGAELVRGNVMQNFSNYFESCGFRHSAFYPCYGLAEATLFVCGGKKKTIPRVDRFRRSSLAYDLAVNDSSDGDNSCELVSCGRPQPEQMVTIVNPKSMAEVAPNEVGEIWISGPSVAKGYWHRPQETTDTFNARLLEAPNRDCLRTGDLGFFHSGELFLTGRLKDIIIIRGKNHYPEDLVRIAESAHPAVRPDASGAFSLEGGDGERLIIVSEIDRGYVREDYEAISDVIRVSMARETGLRVYCVLLIRHGTIPKTATGKVQNHLCRLKFLNGTLDVLADWRDTELSAGMSVESLAPAPPKTLESVKDRLSSYFATCLGAESSFIDDSETLVHYGLDSLMAIELSHFIETEFNVLVPMSELFEIASIANLAKTISGKLDIHAAVPFEPASHKRRTTEFPLSHGQQAIWLLHNLSPESPAYNIFRAARVRGAVDIAALRRAFQGLIARHASLRTTFPEREGKPVQRVCDQVDLHFRELDATSWSMSTLINRLYEIGVSPFDLERGPLFTVLLLKRAENEHVLLLKVHHIVTDFFSINVLVDELRVLYIAETENIAPTLPSASHQYSDWVCWQEGELSGLRGMEHLQYWLEQLKGDLPALNLPTDRPRSEVRTFQGANRLLILDAELTRGLRSLSQTRSTTLYVTLLAAFEVLLHRLTGQQSLIVGSPMANRDRARWARTTGYFANPIALRADFAGDPTFEQFLTQVRQTTLDALQHQSVPFSLVVERLRPQRMSGRSPLIQVMFNLQQVLQSGQRGLLGLALGAPLGPVDMGGLSFEALPLCHRCTPFDITLTIADADNDLLALFEYSTDLFDDITITRIIRHFETVLRGILLDPTERLSKLPVLRDDERHHLLTDWNNTQRDYPNTPCAPQLFEAYAEIAPDAIAVASNKGLLTYGTLNSRANRLAHHLLSLGVKPEERIALFVTRSIEMIVGLLGIVKAGAAYVPLDPQWPAERVASVIKNAEALAVVTEESLARRIPEGTARAICVDADLCQSRSDRNPNITVHPSNLAYMIYTSGSTGQPKGVEVVHKGLVNLIYWHQEAHNVGSSDRATQIASPAFDASIWEIWPYLAAGASVHIPDEETRLAVTKLQTWMEDEGITICFVPTVYAENLLGAINSSSTLRRLLTGGDRLRRWPSPDSRFQVVNHYGPTEASVVTTWAVLECGRNPGQSNYPPIGRPIANAHVYVLDSQLQPVPIGVTGELYVAGVGLARGYFRDERLTAERFLPNPFGNEITLNTRLYRTGDLARYQQDGSLEYVCRTDAQVKIRGCRTEPGEVESAISSFHAVRQTAVVAREDENGDYYLIAYIVANQEHCPSAIELREFLQTKLPAPMIPSAFVFLDAFPVGPNGKLDRNALPLPERRGTSNAYVSPRNTAEQTIASVWKHLLEIEKIGIHDNFFDLGGHSLLIVQAQRELEKAFAREIPLTDLFQYPNVRSLAAHLSPQSHARNDRDDNSLPPNRRDSRHRQSRSPDTADGCQPQSKVPKSLVESAHIAIVGMTCRFPGAKNISQYWQNLREGVESISFFRDSELEKRHEAASQGGPTQFVNARGILGNAMFFDADFFGYSPRDAELIDPQHRIFLECAWEALEDAGYDPGRYNGPIGLFGGTGPSTYLYHLAAQQGVLDGLKLFQVMIGSDKDFLATRVSYKLNLKGPSVVVQSACSTSLVAVHLACQSLLNKECDMALAGAISVRVPEREGYRYHPDGILSPDGHCRAFDASAQGTVISSGAGIVVLKRLDDAVSDRDNIHAIILGSAVNNDGATKVGYTAPSIEGQAEVIARSLVIAGVSPATINYVEAHGTGTRIGDPIEVAALTKVFAPHIEAQTCALGSVKTNIGHTDAAAGIAGLIKTVLSMKHKQIPPTLHFEEPNPEINIANSPFFVVSELLDWKKTAESRRAGVSSFGIGGTNAHLTLQEALPIPQGRGSHKYHLLVLSAKTPTALEAIAVNIADYLDTHDELNFADAAYTLQVGRSLHQHRRMLVCENAREAVGKLRFPDPHGNVAVSERPETTFYLPGQGTQYVGMGLALYKGISGFRERIDQCAAILKAHCGVDFRDTLYPAEASARDAALRINETFFAQPILFMIEYALGSLLMEWGIQPSAMIGHSVGEYVAACLSGVLSLDDALKLIVTRAELVQAQPRGAMVAIALSEDKLKCFIGKELCIAAVDGPSLCVVSGPIRAVKELEANLSKDGTIVRPLRTSHAFHSDMMAPVAQEFRKQLNNIAMNPPRIPYVSSVTGTWITESEVKDPEYWIRQLCDTVRFWEGLTLLLPEPARVFVEVGAERSLDSLVKQRSGRSQTSVALFTLAAPQGRRSDEEELLTALGELWARGTEIDWSAFHAGQQRHRVSLPTYPFERRRYSIEAETNAAIRSTATKRDVSDWFYVPIWKQAFLSRTKREPATSGSPWLVFIEDDVGIGSEFAARLEEMNEQVIRVTRGQHMVQKSNSVYTVNPYQSSDYESLMKHLVVSNRTPHKIVHLWSVDASLAMTFDDIQYGGFYSLIFLAKAIGAARIARHLELWVISNEMQVVTSGEITDPRKATILGPCKVIPQEYPNVACCSVDVSLGTNRSGVEARIAEQLIDEVALSPTEQIVGYRGSRRWVQTFEATQIDKCVSTTTLRKNGVYLITGGLGGVGLAIGEYLAETVQAKLALVGRRPPSTDRLERIRRLGADVVMYEADVSDEDAMKRVVATVKERFGVIHGVLHAAGVAGGGLMELKTPQMVQAVFAPKIMGTVSLARALNDMRLDWFVLCSSMSSITGGIGQVDYCAANSFLDAFAQGASSNAVAVNWDMWGDVGMAVAAEVQKGVRLLTETVRGNGMSSSEGQDAFGRILSGTTSPQIIVSTEDFADVIRRNRVAGMDAVLKVVRDETAPEPAHARPNLENPYIAPRTEIERRVVEIWQDVLGINKVGINDNFVELGGHSLLALEAIARLSELFCVKLSMTIFFANPTIEALCKVLAESQGGYHSAELVDELLDEIEGLSPVEIQRRLSHEVDDHAEEEKA